MKINKSLVIVLVCMVIPLTNYAKNEPITYVRHMMGTGGDGRVVPMAAAPFGMVQLGPDNHMHTSGYHYDATEILGFTHTHKTGGGGTDFMDIMFMPVSGDIWKSYETYPDGLAYKHSHVDETSQPGYYRIDFPDKGITVELTATERCGMHRYTYGDKQNQQVVIDLKHGCIHSTTIHADENFDTVKTSYIEVVDKYTVRGYRVSNGWAPEQHVYFYAEFSKPIAMEKLYRNKSLVAGTKEGIEGTDIRAILQFEEGKDDQLVCRVGISPVSMDGAKKNVQNEIKTWDFDKVKKSTQKKWNDQLSAIQIKDASSPHKEVFYTTLYYAMLYPMLYSDVDGHYRSSDSQVYQGDFRYFAGVLGLWDTFRAQNPLIAILRPDVSNDLIKTFLEHYNHCGQLPIWTLAGVETMCMIGYHSMPVIADAYAKGIRNYNVNAVYEAMKTSANRDTFGYFLKDFRGARNYKKYEYVPCDMEITAVSKTLEYCYDDWCIAQMAKMLGHKEDYDYYIRRAGWYKNVFDKEVNFMRGKNSDGSWRTPFDPFYTNHYRPDDDFCEGTSWQWTFFAPHDGQGLIDLFGSREAFVAKLDSLFIISSEVTGPNPAPDISGMVGQYAHGNEPGHHTLYMYNYAGEPWKGQKLLNHVMYTLYDTSPDGICGNDDTGQVSAWYVFSSMGFYPVTHGTGTYFIGSPIFEDITLKHSNGKLKIKANNVSRENCYVQSVRLNGKPYEKNWLSHEDIFGKNATLDFEMGPQPNKQWGSSPAALPASMKNEKFLN